MPNPDLRKASQSELGKLVSAPLVRMCELTANGLSTVARVIEAKKPRERLYLVLVSG